MSGATPFICHYSVVFVDAIILPPHATVIH